MHGADMKTIQTLILGTAASLIAFGGAQAADLPVKAKPVEYVRICNVHGAGFFFIPGTDTCIKLGGYLRADTTINGGGSHGQPGWSGDSGQHNRFADEFISRSRMALTVDTRTSTEYGVVRTFGQANFQFNTFGTANGAVIGASPTTPVTATQLGGLNASLLNVPGGGYVAVEYVFIQLPASHSASRHLHTRHLGKVFRAISRRFCLAVKTPIPALTTSSTLRSSATVFPGPSAWMIQRSGSAPPSII